MLFDRIGQDINYNEKGFPEGHRKGDVNSNVLFLSLLLNIIVANQARFLISLIV